MKATTDAGYVLVAPQDSTYTYLIDQATGAVVHSWKSAYTAGLTAVLTADGHLMRAGKVGDDHMLHGSGGVIEEYDWDGNLVWQYYDRGDHEFQHHDFTILPNGDVLFIASEVIPAEEAVALGRDPSELRDGVLLADKLVEVKPVGASGGVVVWQWRAIDHIVQDRDPAKANYGDVAAHPERVDVNYQGRALFPDGWTHINAVDYDPATDRILVSVRNYNELWGIDHGTTTAEAAGPAGDLLWRFGNPQAYRAGDASDQVLFGQHDAKWIDDGLPGAGDILVFDNGVDCPRGQSSRVLEIAVPEAAASRPGLADRVGTVAWSYAAPTATDMFSSKMSGAQRLPDGDTLVTVGDTGQIFEVTPQGDTIWSYDTDLALLEGATSRQEGAVFYATWYAADDPALAGRALDGEDPALGALARLGASGIVDALRLARLSGRTAALPPALART
ncbi:aryl-sulfate sulfotransferase [Solidesulfovibrio sp.]|uniref:aryl-sulfate sulfotransferase n=1 Tax=Solidesulfovibrio sp. TaxID=2910990 RepID=UPI002639320E|nr:aryl-sulfate sulfotransferase [Solidesulfovibrio sp.]